MIFRACAILCFALGLPTVMLGQNYIYQTGNPAFSTQIPIEHGFIDVNNGDVHLEFPIATPPQRGGVLGSNARLVYDSRIWKIADDKGSLSWQPTNSGIWGGWTILTGGETGSGVTYSPDGAVTSNVGCPTGNSGGYDEGQDTQLTWDNFVWIDPVGTSHSFNFQYVDNTTTCQTSSPTNSSDSNGGWSADSSGLYMLATGTAGTGLGPQTFTIKDKNGTQVYPAIRDRNGNSLTVEGNGNTVDTVGRTPVMVSYVGDKIYLDVLTTNNGTRARYVITLVSVNYDTHFGEPDVKEVSGSVEAIQSIQLPDGSQYQFTYDSATTNGNLYNYGEMTSMTLPTGGVVKYGYKLFEDSFQNYNQWLAFHTSDGGTTSFAPKTLSACSSSKGCQESTTVTSPDGNDTVYTFNLDKAQIKNGSSWQSNVTAYQGQASGNVRLKAEDTSYTYSTATAGNTYVGQQATTITTIDTLADVGVATQTMTSLDPNNGSTTETKIWNYQTPFSSAPDVDTNYTYQGTFLQQTTVKDGAGNQLSQTTNDLDGVGNVTGQHQWINTTGQTLDTAFHFDSLGSLQYSTAPEGKTVYGYDPTDALVTSVTPPTPSSGAVLTTQTTYDASTGVVTSTTDPNGNVTNYADFDTLNRVKTITYPPTSEYPANSAGSSPTSGVTTLEYTDAQTVSEHPAFEVGTNGWTIKQADGYGRPSRVETATGLPNNPWYVQDTCYDTSGRVNFQSYRYQGQGFSSPKVCSGAGDSYSYDALGRIKQTTHGDGSTIVYSYTGRATKITDENNVSKITQTDAFGRVTTVCELSSNTTMPASGSPVGCGTDIAGTGFVTAYTYNPAAFQSTVAQGVQQRIFTTDSLGRQVSAQEPESGKTSYSYAFNGTGLLVTRARPQANQTSPSVLTTTQTQYDALDRPVSVTYSDGTGSKTYNYDIAQPGATNVLGLLSSQYAAASSAGPAVETFSYDALGRTIQVLTCSPSTCGSFNTSQSYAYDFAGNIVQATDGAGATLAYGYTPANEIASVTSPQSAAYPFTLLSNVTNGPFGPVSYQLGNGLYSVNQYDGLGRRTGGWVCSGSSSPSCSGGTQLYGFTIGINGSRVNQACDTALNNCGTMGYDDFNRLTSRTATSGVALNDSWTYDRYGNRWSQTASPGGYQGNFSFNPANNQAAGFSYDAAGNLVNDTGHSYSYDAEGNVKTVDGGSTAKYAYDASNNRVRGEFSYGTYEELFNLAGQKTVIFDASSGSVLEENTRLGALPLAAYEGGILYFEHQDWLGTERLLTDNTGNAAGSYSSLPFGDNFSENGTDLDPYHFAGLEHQYESGLDHAQYREYESPTGRWMVPDSYSGSYKFNDPQSLNRYSYVENNPLSFTDPTGQFGLATAAGCSAGPEGCAIGLAVDIGEAVVGGAILDGLKDLTGLFSGPSFHGSLKPRPNAQPWDEYNIHYGPNIAGALGLPDTTCEFGPCGGDVGQGFINGLAATVPFCTQHPNLCLLGEDALSLLEDIPAIAIKSAPIMLSSDSMSPSPGMLHCEQQYESDVNTCRQARSRACYAQAAERYSACLSGKPVSPLNF